MILPRVPAPFVIVVMAVILVGGAFIGFQMLTATAEIEEQATCENQIVAAGDPVTANLVSVDVYNGSQRAGLANRVSINLQRRGFLPGQIGNSEIEVESDGVTIVAAEPDDARVRLVAAQFGDVDIIEPAGSAPAENIVVVVGNETNEDLAKGAAKEVETKADLTVCIPTAPEVATSSQE